MSEGKEPGRTPLHTAIVKAIADRLQDIYTAMPGALEAYDWQTGKARVKPQIQEIQDSNGKYKPLPVIAGVPVVFPGGAAASLTMPLAAGDTGLLIFTKHAMEVWLARGGDVAPGDPRQFDLTDAVFVPGLRPFSSVSPAESANALTLKNGAAKIKIEGGKVAIGNPTAVPVPIAPTAFPAFTGPVEVLAILEALIDQLSVSALVTGSAVINPVFTANMLLLKQNIAQLRGDL